MDNRIEICEQIIKDTKNDVQDLNGEIVASYTSYQSAASIAALANIVKSLLEEKEVPELPKNKDKTMKIKLSEGLIEQIQDRLKTPEQQAEYLIEKLRKAGCRSFEEAEVNSARQSAQIYCDEIIKELERIVCPNPDRVKYWQQVSDYILNRQ